MSESKPDVYNVYMQDDNNLKPVRIAECVPITKAQELVLRFDKSGHHCVCYEVRADEDPLYFYEGD